VRVGGRMYCLGYHSGRVPDSQYGAGYEDNEQGEFLFSVNNPALLRPTNVASTIS
jgi:hypothetical protein